MSHRCSRPATWSIVSAKSCASKRRRTSIHGSPPRLAVHLAHSLRHHRGSPRRSSRDHPTMVERSDRRSNHKTQAGEASDVWACKNRSARGMRHRHCVNNCTKSESHRGGRAGCNVKEVSPGATCGLLRRFNRQRHLPSDASCRDRWIALPSDHRSCRQSRDILPS